MLKSQIEKTRAVKASSIQTYMSSLLTISKALKGDLNNTDFLKDYDKVMEFLEPLKITSKKNKLTAIIVALKSDDPQNTELIDKYGKALKELSDKYLVILKEQQKTDTQKKNWIEYNELVELINDLMTEVKSKQLIKKNELNDKEFNLLQELIILRTYLKFPLRNNFSDMKIITLKEYKKLGSLSTKNNYLVINGQKKYFYINQFKNQKFLGSKILDIPSNLNTLINVWLRFNKSGYYLVKDRVNPMNANNITKFLNKIFKKYMNKRISTSMIRHIVISEMLKNKPTIKDKEEEDKKIENTFFHSKAMNDLYRKID